MNYTMFVTMFLLVCLYLGLVCVALLLFDYNGQLLVHAIGPMPCCPVLCHCL